MIRIYRMWRYVRLVERTFFNDNPSATKRHSPDCLEEFCQLKTISRRNYRPSEALKAHYAAHLLRYIDVPQGVKKKKGETISISGDGLLFTSHTRLINELAKSIASVGSLTAVVISALALYFAIRK